MEKILFALLLSISTAAVVAVVVIAASFSAGIFSGKLNFQHVPLYFYTNNLLRATSRHRHTQTHAQ